MGLIIISSLHTGSQFALHSLYSSAVPRAGALQRLLLRHDCSDQPNAISEPSDSPYNDLYAIHRRADSNIYSLVLITDKYNM